MTRRGYTMLEPSVDLVNGTHLSLPGLKMNSLHSLSLCFFLSCPTRGGREDVENQVPCRLMKTGYSNPKKQVNFKFGSVWQMRCPIWGNTWSCFGPAGVLMWDRFPLAALFRGCYKWKDYLNAHQHFNKNILTLKTLFWKLEKNIQGKRPRLWVVLTCVFNRCFMTYKVTFLRKET